MAFYAAYLTTAQFLSPAVQLALAVASFVMGACVGSFLNVVIYRLPLDISVANPKRSFCPSCRYQIPMWHNIPLVSWLVLRGRCAQCGASISPRYLIVELLTAVIFLMVFLWFGRDQPWLVLPMFGFLALCVAATYIDFDHMIIPDEITYGGMVAGVVCSVVFPWMITSEATWITGLLPAGLRAELRWTNLLESLVGAGMGLLLVWLVVQFGKLVFGRLKYESAEPVSWEVSQPEGEPEPIIMLGPEKHLWTDVFSRKSDRLRMTCQSCQFNGGEQGAGQLVLSEDLVEFTPEGGEASSRKLEEIQHMSGRMTKAVVPREAMGLGDVKFMGLVGAFLGWKGILFTLFSASIIGSVVAVVMILVKRREWAARIPFGPYLALGAALWVFGGPAILNWYWALSSGLRASPES
jgi:leader peptidase (prepilin peptidase)/N-methyltransferase